jgi:homoserine dehydrogenase
MSTDSVVRVGIVGLGTVGSGTFNILSENLDSLERKAGKKVWVSHVGARRDNPNVDIKNSSFAGDIKVSRDILDVVKDDSLDIIVELIGGTDTALDVVKQALENGKHVVTANKALIAEHGNELFKLATSKGKVLAFEAAVAGGIPIIKALTEGMSANNISWLAGIINGTGNFILTEMKDKGRDFDSVLKEAQDLGYAEADPTFDIEGIDAAHKLAILSALAFSVPVNFDKVFTEGITKITPLDLEFAENFGYKIKHLGISKKTKNGIEARVHPTLVPKENLLAQVDGVMNAVMLNGDAVGNTMYYGAGAGAEATGSAVCADIIDIARGDTASKNIVAGEAKDFVAIKDVESAYYLRLQAKDEAGVLAAISQVLSEQNISIEGIYQQEVKQGETSVPVVIISKRVKEQAMNEAIEKMQALSSIESNIAKIRIEHFK